MRTAVFTMAVAAGACSANSAVDRAPDPAEFYEMAYRVYTSLDPICPVDGFGMNERYRDRARRIAGLRSGLAGSALQSEMDRARSDAEARWEVLEHVCPELSPVEADEKRAEDLAALDAAVSNLDRLINDVREER